MADPAAKLSLAEARHIWRTRQRLHPVGESAASSSLADLVSAIGWVPVVLGDPSVYLALHARGGLTHRSELDEAVYVRNELAVVPGPRGSAWLVPAADASLARAFAVADHASREARVASACAITSQDLRAAREALRSGLESPVTPESLRAGLPAQCNRSLGEVGRRAGSPTIAALVLRGMWILGEVLRVPVEARVDCVRSRYVLDARPRVVPSAAVAVDDVAARWFNAHAPTTARAFAAAFGIATGRAVAALKPLKGTSVEIEGLGMNFLLPSTLGNGSAAAPAEATVDLLASRDPLLDAHPTLAGLCEPSLIRAAVGRNQLPLPAVLHDGEVVAVWQWEAATREVAWRPLQGALASEISVRIDIAAAAMRDFISREIYVETRATVAPSRKTNPQANELDVM